MTKRDLIEEVARHYPRFSRRDAEVMVNAVFDSMTATLSKPERIEIRGFGSFVVKARPARKGRNPRTGEVVTVPAKNVPLFKVGRELRLRVDGQPVDARPAAKNTAPPPVDEPVAPPAPVHAAQLR